jgi:hypothetical protein
LPNEPTSLNAFNITSSSVLVQWRPEFDGGSEQSFELLINNQFKYETNEDNLLIEGIHFKHLKKKYHLRFIYDS